MTEHGPVRIAFVCVQNAGRSQMAYALADRELDRSSLDSEIELLTGGTRPAARIHPVVVEAMAAIGLDVSNRTPRELTIDELQRCDLVITMGCSAEDVCPAGWGGENRDWDLPDPHGEPLERVVEIRNEIQRRVVQLLDEFVGSDRLSG
ncbi:MAG: low molecular weight phosphatase family protein [Halobacteriales archaeon]